MSGCRAARTRAFPGFWYRTHGGWIPGLTWKTEYRFSEFDRRDNAEFVTATGVLTGNVIRDKMFTQTATSNSVYRFNWGGPVVAKY